MSNALAITLLVILIVLSAFFSCSEIVYDSVNALRVKKAVENKAKNAKLVNSILQNHTNTLSTILVGNNLVNIAASSIATVFFIKVFGEDNGPILATIIMAFAIMSFGEILPKAMGAKFNYSLAFIFALPIKVISMILKPIVFVLTKFIDLLSKLWHKKEKEEVTDEELITMVDTIEEEGYIDEAQSELVKSAIEFIDVTAHEIMIPRVDVFAFDLDDDINNLLDDEEVYKHSRIPVYKESLDDVVGILNTNELLKAKLSNSPIDVLKMVTKPLYVFKTQPISSILHLLKNEHKHIAIIKDEYGGTMGILTMEDILEELVGDILDEMDPYEVEYEKINDNEYIVDGDMNIYDLFDLIGYNDKDFDSEYNTIGGFCTDKLERFPIENDTFDFENYTFIVLKVDEFRVEKVHIIIHEVVDDEEDDD